MNRQLTNVAALLAPVVVTAAAMLVTLAVILDRLPPSSLRDALVGSVIGGLVALVGALTAQQLQGAAERRRTAEEAAREEVRIVGALARELAECGAYITTMVSGASIGLLRLLPTKAWDALQVDLGRFWHPHSVAYLALIYHQIEMTNEALVELGTPPTGMAKQPILIMPALAAYLAATQAEASIAVTELGRRADLLRLRHGWPAKPSKDDFMRDRPG